MSIRLTCSICKKPDSKMAIIFGDPSEIDGWLPYTCVDCSKKGFNAKEELKAKEGVFVAVSETDSVEDIEKECLITLAKILAYDSEITASGDLYLGDPRTHRRLTGCLVLEPERAIYIREDNEVIEGSIPWGGTLVSIHNETIKFPMSNHYLLA